MPISSSGVAIIESARNGDLFAIDADDLVWLQAEGEDGAGAGEIRHYAVVKHLKLGELRWTLWEYPVGVTAKRLTSVGDHVVKRDIAFDLVPDDAASQASAKNAC